MSNNEVASPKLEKTQKFGTKKELFDALEAAGVSKRVLGENENAMFGHGAITWDRGRHLADRNDDGSFTFSLSFTFSFEDNIASLVKASSAPVDTVVDETEKLVSGSKARVGTLLDNPYGVRPNPPKPTTPDAATQAVLEQMRAKEYDRVVYESIQGGEGEWTEGPRVIASALIVNAGQVIRMDTRYEGIEGDTFLVIQKPRTSEKTIRCVQADIDKETGKYAKVEGAPEFSISKMEWVRILFK